jgi:GxxExxY protein
MYDDWQPMTTSNRNGNSNGNGNGNGNNGGNGGEGSGGRKNYSRGRNQGGYQNNNNNNNRNYNSYNPNYQQPHANPMQQNPNQLNNPANQGPNVDMILREEAYNVVGCAINILNELGPGLPVECYEKAIRVEFSLKDIPLLENQTFPIIYKEVKVGEFTAKLIAYETVIVLPIVSETITDVEIARIINQLKVAHYQAGLIFNFRYPKLQWQRVIL